MVGLLGSTDATTVIVIDALDECKDEGPSSPILSVLGRFVEQMLKVKFFITGQPEPRIKTGFSPRLDRRLCFARSLLLYSK